MKWNSRRVTAWAYTAPADLRKGFDGLTALVSEALDRDPLNGDLYLFVSRNRIRAKVLHWDGTGLCVYAKRLEKGKFASLWKAGEGEAVQLTTTELSLFLEGSVLVGKISLSPPEMKHFSLASETSM